MGITIFDMYAFILFPACHLATCVGNNQTTCEKNLVVVDVPESVSTCSLYLSIYIHTYVTTVYIESTLINEWLHVPIFRASVDSKSPVVLISSCG